ncbi:hypothetical protein P9112_002592 [Eukaryota sp. TZLM1-RC]
MQMQPGIILLKEGTDDSQGVPQIVSNIAACSAVADVVRTTLGPRGLDKLIRTARDRTISNDGATIMSLLDVVHPAGKMLVDISRSQDFEQGDGTTSVVVLAVELMKLAKPFIEDKVHPRFITSAYRLALSKCLEKIEELQTTMTDSQKLLEKCAATSMSSKLIAGYRDFFAPMAVNAVMHLKDHDYDLSLLGIKKVPGGSMEDSVLVDGVAFQKTFSYAGFEQQPKKFKDPKIVLLNVELELKAEATNAEVRLSDPDQFKSIVDAEWQIIYDKLDAITASGANIVLSMMPIGDLATQYFADRDIFCAGRVPKDDMRRVSTATGASVQSSCNNLSSEVLGTCEVFEERQIGSERFNLFLGVPESKTVTIILRGGANEFIEEVDRSLHDAICVVKRAAQSSNIVAGGGAIEMELSKYLREFSKTIHGKQQLMVAAFARALEVVPRQLAENAGFDTVDVMNKLRHYHHVGNTWEGVDIDNGGTCDCYETFVWEPSSIKVNVLAAATEAACTILSVDETIKNPKAEQGQQQQQPVRGRGRGRGRAPRVLRGRGG